MFASLLILLPILWGGLALNQQRSNLSLSIFTVSVWLFLFYQLSGSFLCFSGMLNDITGWITLVLPALFCFQYRKIAIPQNSSMVLAFLPALLLFGIYACPDPWYRDSLTYHLALARQYSLSGGFTETDHVVFAYFPQGWQSLLAVFHTLGENGYPPFNPRMLGVLLSVITGIGICGILQEMKCPQKWSVTAGYLFLLIPTTLEFGASCYVQPWLVMLCLYTIYSSTLKKKLSAFQIGILCGFVVSLKYSGLFLVALLMPIYLRQRNPSFFMGLLVTGTPFYLRNLMAKGNPLYPMAYNIFGGEDWDNWRAMAYEITLSNYGAGRELWDYLALPFRVFTTMEMTNAFQGSVGIVLAYFSVMMLMRFKSLTHNQKVYAYCSIGWGVLWAFQVQQIRFLMPAFPLLIIASVPLVSKIHSKSWVPSIIASSLWLIHPMNELFTKQNTQMYFYQPKQYLERQLPENIPVYQYLNAQQTEKVWLVWMRGYHYYLNPKARIDSVFGAYRMELLLLNQSEKQIQRTLLTDQISHIIINWKYFLLEDNADRLGEGKTALLRRRFTELLDQGILKAERQFGPVWVYSVSDDEDESSKMSE